MPRTRRRCRSPPPAAVAARVPPWCPPARRRPRARGGSDGCGRTRAQANVARVDSPLGLYVHVPYCAARCGYCDFNTYVAPEAQRARFASDAIAELDLAARMLGERVRPLATVFFGGGTPTLLPPADLVAILRAAEARFGLAPGAEVTVEANPESVDGRTLAQLRAGGATRVSFGMQSAAPHVLATLDRRHTPGRAGAAVAEAWRAGFEHVSVDLIYG